MLMAEFARREVSLPVKIVVVKNNTLGQIKWEQMVFSGKSRIWCRTPSYRFAAVATEAAEALPPKIRRIRE